MIHDKKMKYIGSSEGFEFYLFTPTFFRLYYGSRDNDAVHMRTISHKVHMWFYLLWGV